jgi:hypothetical protein
MIILLGSGQYIKKILYYYYFIMYERKEKKLKIKQTIFKEDDEI